jgi:uroporphyrinogen-III synthase
MTGPLSGKRVLNTRALDQAGELDALLTAAGAVPLSYPCIEICAVADAQPLDDAIIALIDGNFDWLLITSANTVRAIAIRLAELDIHLPASPPFRTAVVGPGTAEELHAKLGLHADVIPATFRAAELAAAVPIKTGDRVLIPQSAIAPPDLANALAARGATVTTVTAYCTVTGSGGVNLSALLANGEVDAIVFASSSAVDGCAARLHAEGGHIDLLRPIPRVCIGPGTARTAAEQGLPDSVIPVEHTLGGVLDALQSVLSVSREETRS